MSIVVRFRLRYVDNTPIMGLLRIYTGTEIVEQIPVPISGDASAVLDDGVEYNVSFVTLSPVYAETLTLTAEDGAIYTIYVTPSSIVAPPGKCVVRGRIVGPTGKPTRRLRASVSLVDGDAAIGEDIVLNDSERIAVADDGLLVTEMYRGRTYRVTLTGIDEYAAFDSFLVHAPDRPYARFADLLFPFPAHATLPDIDGPGAYALSLLMSDGRTLTKYVDVSPFVRVASDGDVTATLTSIDTVAHVTLAGDMSAWSLQIYGRPAQFRIGADVWDIARGGSERVIASAAG